MSETGTAVSFGAGSGLGGAIARRFARGGLHAGVVRRKAEELALLVEEIHAAGGAATPFGVDAGSAWTHELDLRPFLEPW